MRACVCVCVCDAKPATELAEQTTIPPGTACAPRGNAPPSAACNFPAKREGLTGRGIIYWVSGGAAAAAAQERKGAEAGGGRRQPRPGKFPGLRSALEAPPRQGKRPGGAAGAASGARKGKAGWAGLRFPRGLRAPEPFAAPRREAGGSGRLEAPAGICSAGFLFPAPEMDAGEEFLSVGRVSL